MKKNVFSRTLAVLASTAVLGAASMMSANAAGEVFQISSTEALPGDTVTLYINAKTGDLLNSIDATFVYDSALTAYAAKSANPDWSVASEVDEANNLITLASFTMLDGGLPDSDVVAMDFTVPADAEPGTVYEVNWNEVTDVDLNDGSNAATSGTFNGGTITVVAPEVEPTTEAQTEAETTAAATTKAPTTGAPKTGTAGVAVAVAGLVTAGATAVVLKKRH